MIFFEGTYTTTFSGNDDPTPRYDYNQVMYRLDLADPPAEPAGAGLPDGRRFVRGRPRAAGPGPAPFFALNRPGEGTVPIVAAGEGKPADGVVFHALPADTRNPPKATVPLYAERGGAGGITRLRDEPASGRSPPGRPRLARADVRPPADVALGAVSRFCRVHAGGRCLQRGHRRGIRRGRVPRRSPLPENPECDPHPGPACSPPCWRPSASRPPEPLPTTRRRARPAGQDVREGDHDQGEVELPAVLARRV